MQTQPDVYQRPDSFVAYDQYLAARPKVLVAGWYEGGSFDATTNYASGTADEAGLNVTVAPAGEEAVSLYQAGKHDYILFNADTAETGKGIEFLNALVQVNPNVKIIAVGKNTSWVQATIHAQGIPTLPPRFESEQLLLAIAKYAAKQPPQESSH